jgi:hypothetical protein
VSLLTPGHLLNLFEFPPHRWPWIIVLAAILQRAPLLDRLMFLQQREGTLLLQLLYQVLLEDSGLGGQGTGEEEEPKAVSFTKEGLDVGECLTAVNGKGVSQAVDELVTNHELAGVEVHSLVLLVLQCLLYKPLRADREKLKVLQSSKLMLLDAGR